MTSKEWRFEGYSKNKKLFKAMFRENKQTRIILTYVNTTEKEQNNLVPVLPGTDSSGRTHTLFVDYYIPKA